MTIKATGVKARTSRSTMKVFTAIFALSFIFMAASAHYAYGADKKDATASAASVERVPASQVCMINNTVMAKDQIPVVVDGKTYYGCCEGCVSKLKGYKEARHAVDPLTGKEVDKATAFIVGINGQALYFESSENAMKYMEKAGK